jgi:hypothetical protein
MLIFSVSASFGQRIVATGEPIEMNNLIIQNGSKTISFGETESSIRSKLGAPDSQPSFHYEMISKTGSIMKYGSNDLYILDGKLETFNLYDNSFIVGLEGNFIKVGDNTSVLSSFYSNANIFKRSDLSAYYIDLKENGILQEGDCLVIQYDSNNRINHIYKFTLN